MAINTTTINGDVFLPDGSVREKSYVIFEQTGFDTDNVDDAVIVSFPIRAAIADDGSIDVDLWPNQDGVRSTFYRVTFEIYNGTAKHLVDGGKISVPASGGPYALNDLLPVSPPAGATVEDYIAYLEAAVASAEAAAASIVGASDLLFTPEQYGAVGDGVNDDTSAMQQFFAAIEGGVGNLSNDAVYAISSRIFPPAKNWTLNANGATFDYSGMANGDGDSAGSLLSVAGSVDATIGLTSIAEVADAFGQVVTTVVSDTAHGLSVGDDVLLSSDDVIDAGHNLTQETRGQYVRVDTVVSATEFTANQPIYEALTTNPVMTRINWAENIHINGPLTIKGAGRRPTAIGYSGLAFTYARDCSVSDLTTDLVDYQAFSRDNCLRVNAGQLTFKFAPKGASTATQYGDTFKNASTDCRTGGILSYGGKHPFDWTRNTNPGIGRNCVIGPIVAYDTWDAAVATHGNSRDLKFSTIKAINCLYAFGSRVAGVRVDELYGEDCYEVLKITDDTRNLSVGSVRAKNCSFVVRAKDTEWIGALESRNINIGRVEADGVLQNTIYLDWSDIPVINETDAPVTGGSSNTITMGAFPQTNYNYSGALIGSQIIMDWDGAGGGTAQTRTVNGHTWNGTTNTITVSSWTVAPVAGTSTYKIRSFVDDISIGDVVSKNCAGADVFINGNVRRLVIGDLDIISEGINANPAVLISATADSYPQTVRIGRPNIFQKGLPAISTLAVDVFFKGESSNVSFTPFTKDAAGIQDAADYVGVRGGGEVVLGMGDYTLTSSTAGTNEGVAVVLTALHSDVTFVGAGAKLKPASNRIEMFAQNGASNVAFRGVEFDNSANGALDNQVKGASADNVGTGVAEKGNAANAAIRQYNGPSLTIDRCTFKEFAIGVHYVGDYLDNLVLSGEMVGINSSFDGCGMAYLIDQPESLLLTGNLDINGYDLTNFDTSTDPGHMVYLTDRSGPGPYTIVVVGNHSRNRPDQPIKIRKGETVTVTGNSLYNVGRGIMLEAVESGVVDGNDIRLIDYGTSNCSGIELTGTYNVTVGPTNIVKIVGANAWGVRCQDGINGDGRNNRLLGMTVIDDVVASSGKGAYIWSGQDGGEIIDVRYINTGDNAKSSMIDLANEGLNRTLISRPRYTLEGTGGGAGDIVVRSRDGCNPYVEVNPFFLDAGYNEARFILENGSGTADVAILGQPKTLEYEASIAAAPEKVGQMAIVGAVVYVATGTASAADWQQVTN